MIPISDSTPKSSFPFVNYTIILINIFVFIIQLSAPNVESLIQTYAFVPERFNFFDPNSYLYILYSIFMHGGFMHIIFNMWFLHIFGDNVEDRIGHINYLVFYLLAGLAATMAQYFTDPSGNIPILGASGAISGVAGAYFVLFRHSTVKTIVPLFLTVSIIELSTPFFLGYWFLLQLLSGAVALTTTGAEGGVAWFAHIGGFAFGYLYAKFIPRQAT